MKKFLIKSICLVLVTVTTFSLCGCFETIREYDVGDFRVVLALGQKDRKDPNNYLNLIGLSEAGKQKRIIVLPKRINGHPYYLLFQSTPGYTTAFFKGEMEKIYFEYPGDYSQDSEKVRVRVSAYTGYLKKVISNFEIKVELLSLTTINRYYNDKQYRLKMEKAEFEFDKFKKEIQPANLQYMYNFEGAENDGYFWVDSVDNGEKIEVMPDTPEREGFTFGGWYTEEKCVNKFDFNTVFNTPILEEGDIYPDDYVTYLYAKWVQNKR